MSLRFDYRTLDTDAAIIEAATTYFNTGLGPCRINGHPEINTCVYRRPDGHTCVAGAMMPDELYIPEMENQTIWSAAESCSQKSPGHTEFYLWVDSHSSILRDLQNLHDRSSNWDDLVLNEQGTKGLADLAARAVADA